MAERQFGPYRLVRQVAVGGMAEIHLAKTKGIAGFEKYVALKMIHPNFAEDEQFIQMLVDEAKIAVQLTHGNIAQTFDLGRVGETYYITMEYVDGADLYKILRRGSEQDIEMPLDVCAFVAKEVASALDHAHRKKDHVGKPLGIVHRDVSPQNVLVSYSGEVKLVDFGIAKATMKARQTAVGVIKGKYYYMSPEQAWGDPIDYRSDIFSAGIVLYEMITGQMLYLEEDLQKLLDMARKAEIAPPTTLRKGVPPQLVKIVMHALQKQPDERYQSAGDLASDLERFLHAYSPVFTAAKLSNLVKQIIGDPSAPADDFEIEVREGVNATHTLDITDLKEELRDENSVIFRMAELKPPSPAPAPVPAPPAPAPAPRPARVTQRPPAVAPPSAIKPVITRAQAAEAPTKPAGVGRIPSITKPPPAIAPAAAPRPRQPNEDTRQLEPSLIPPIVDDDSNAQPWEDDLENIGERTMITAPSPGAFMMDTSEHDLNHDGVDATLITGIPQPEDAEPDTSRRAPEPAVGHDPVDAIADQDDDEGPTLARDFRTDKPRTSKPGRAPAPAAFAAKIHAPAVSELRKPRPSKRTPQDGVPAQPPGNVLQQMISRQASEPMPVPRPEPPPHERPAATPVAAPPQYMTDASGLPLGLPTPPGMAAVDSPENIPAHLQPYAQQPTGFPPPYAPPSGQPPQGYPPQGYPPQGYPPQGYPPQGYPPQGYPPQGYPAQGYPPQGYPPQGYPPQGYPPQGYPPQGYPPAVTPGALYQFQPAPQKMTLTGQLRLFEVDELPSQYRLGAARRRWFAYIVAGLTAISVAAAATFFIIRSTRESTPTVGTVRVDSVPPGAEVIFDGARLIDKTPMTIPSVPAGTRHAVRVELPHYKPYEETVDVTSDGRDVPVMAQLVAITGKLQIITTPSGADLFLNGTNRGRTPITINDLDLSPMHLELRIKDYQPYIEELTWPASGVIQRDLKLKR